MHAWALVHYSGVVLYWGVFVKKPYLCVVSIELYILLASIRSAFMLKLRRELGDRIEHFQSLDSFEKSSYVLGSEAWEEYSSGLLGSIKDFVLSVWEERKVRLYGEHANVHQSHSQNDSGDLRGVAGGDGELGCLCGKAGTSICVMVPPIHLGAWSMALMLWLPFELLFTNYYGQSWSSSSYNVSMVTDVDLRIY